MMMRKQQSVRRWEKEGGDYQENVMAFCFERIVKSAETFGDCLDTMGQSKKSNLHDTTEGSINICTNSPWDG